MKSLLLSIPYSVSRVGVITTSRSVNIRVIVTIEMDISKTIVRMLAEQSDISRRITRLFREYLRENKKDIKQRISRLENESAYIHGKLYMQYITKREFLVEFYISKKGCKLREVDLLMKRANGELMK